MQNCPLFAGSKRKLLSAAIDCLTFLIRRLRIRSSDVRSVTRLRFLWLFWVPMLCRDSTLQTVFFPIHYLQVTLRFGATQSVHRKSVVKQTNKKKDGILLQCFTIKQHKEGLIKRRIKSTEISRFSWPLKWGLPSAWVDTV